MINTTHLIKVGVAWISILHVVCFVGVVLFPPLRQQFMLYSLHTYVTIGHNMMTLATFVVGLMIWNIIAALITGLFAVLFNNIKH